MGFMPLAHMLMDVTQPRGSLSPPGTWAQSLPTAGPAVIKLSATSPIGDFHTRNPDHSYTLPARTGEIMTALMLEAQLRVPATAEVDRVVGCSTMGFKLDPNGLKKVQEMELAQEKVE